MNSLIDIHSHFLPGIDDGAKDFEISIQMLRIAEQNKIRKIILTPHNKPMHHNADASEIRRLTEKLQQKIQQEGMDIQLYTGNEIYYRSNVLELLDGGQICTMAASSYVLIEFNPKDDFDHIRNAVYQIVAGGYQPVIAHVERYENVCSHMDRIEELIEMGVYLQVNAGSIMGQYGFGIQILTRRLLRQRLVHFVATDAHNTGKRGPYLQKCAEFVCRKYGKAYAQKIFYDNPARIIAGEYI